MQFPTFILFLLQFSNSLAFDNFLAPIGLALEDTFHWVRCGYTECCNKYGIPANFTGLEDILRQRIYGQHLVQDIVVNALRSHWGDHKPQKALTLSFHGWPGSGKNYVARFVIETMYARGSKSQNVHHFIGRVHFASNDKVEHYQENLKLWIRGNVTKCSKQLFIFDEVDKMPAGVLNVIKPMIDYRDDVDGVDYRDCVFIFLSNTGAQIINEHYMELWITQGRKRDDLKLHDFEKMIAMGAFNEAGGFHHADAIKVNLIDHYVPFLPMERRHVKLCILDEFKQRDVVAPTEELINEAMEFIEWGGPSNEKVFSTTGCKRISQKVGTIAAKYKLGFNRPKLSRDDL